MTAKNVPWQQIKADVVPRRTARALRAVAAAGRHLRARPLSFAKWWLCFPRSVRSVVLDLELVANPPHRLDLDAGVRVAESPTQAGYQHLDRVRGQLATSLG
jgi:hypothetical protein